MTTRERADRIARLWQGGVVSVAAIAAELQADRLDVRAACQGRAGAMVGEIDRGYDRMTDYARGYRSAASELCRRIGGVDLS
jgi:hypothetical protein